MGEMVGTRVWVRVACELAPLPTVLVVNSGLWMSYARGQEFESSSLSHLRSVFATTRLV